ncbi:alpha/beta fold hydrolase [Zavarzinia sp.]|uniref:alpha/beta fold hydrolase n=1 Tax=Zavarzinia sp. TaxID=2027920 RepID=UPI00356296C8
MTALPPLRRFALGPLPLAAGGIVTDARLCYRTYGRLNETADNCILLPTYYTGTDRSYLPLIGPGRALDPAHYFIVIPNMFGNGVSTSPSHWPAGAERAAFPAVGVIDNVRAQYRLLTEELGVRQIALASGWSMGAIQAWHWAALFPSMVRALLPVCGTARCWPLNRVFLEGVKAALEADGGFAGGAYLTPPEAGLRAFGRAYCGWAYSAQFFREARYRLLGAETLEDFLRAWEEEHLAIDAGDLLAMLRTWITAEIGDMAAGDWVQALGRVTARTIVMPCDRDAYFTLEEARLEVAAVPGAELRPLASPYGHCAGAPGRFPDETVAIEAAMRELLSPG